MLQVLGLATIFNTAAAAQCGDDVLIPARPASIAGSTVAESCAAPIAETPADGTCATQEYAPPSVAAVWTSTNTWTEPSVAAVWTSTNTWDSSSHTCSDSSLTTEAACIAPGTCDDAGNTGPADAAACAQLFSDSGSCSDTSLTTEAACIAPGTCDDAGNTDP